MFIQCPFCQTKLAVTPDGIPEMGKEKRCVNCWNCFRVVRTPDEVVVQYQQGGGTGRAVDDARSEQSLHGNLTGVGGGHVQEQRYRIEGDTPSGGGGEGFGEAGVSDVFADFFDLDREPTSADAATSPKEGAAENVGEIPIEKAINIDDVFGTGSDSISPSGMQEPQKPRILSSGDLAERQEQGFRRDFRIQPARPARGHMSGAFDGVRSFLQNMTGLDLVLLGAFLLVLIGASLGFTDAGFFGMSWFRGGPAKQEQEGSGQRASTFTREEVYHLISLVPDSPRATTPEAFRGNKTILPEGDYSKIFVEEVEVAVRSEPSGATVTRGERVLGVTPLLVRLPHSEDGFTLLVSYEGLVSQSLRVSATCNQEFDVVLRAPAPRPASPATGSKPTRAKPTPGADEKTGKDEEFLIY